MGTKTLLSRLEGWWFVPIAPERLALLRILIGGWCLFYLGKRINLYDRIVSGDPSNFEPTGVVRLFHDVPIEPALFMVLMGMTICLNILFILGLAFRVVAPVFAVLLLWLLCYRNSWSMIYHSDNLLVLHVLVLAAAPSARVLSLDALHGRSTWKNLPARPHPAYGWPVMLICALTVSVYFLAAIAKITGETGWGWVSGEVLRTQLIRDGIRKELLEDGATPMMAWLCQNVWLLTILAFGSLMLELLAPVAILHRRAGWIWCLLVFPMHWGIFFAMDILFRYQMYGFMFLPFFPIERVARSVRSVCRYPAWRRTLARRGDHALP